MQKIESSLEKIRDDIKSFYDYKKWHFVTMNGVTLDDDTLELQWIFAKYETMDENIIYYTNIKYDEVVPTIEDLIPSSIISQRELVDMYGIEIEGSEKGLYLDEDSPKMPLRGCKV